MANTCIDESYLNCGICLDFASNAVETVCCHQLFCQDCLADISSCPICRKSLKIVASHAIRRIIGKISKPCNFCKEMIENSNWESHLQVCEERNNFNCIFSNCSFKGYKKDVLEHITSTHEDEITSNKYEIVSKTADSCNIDLISKKKNHFGYTARLGKTGKYYCGQRLGFRCSCCNGTCGPDSGCNCTACFRLDLNTRVLPKGFYINNLGFAVRKGLLWEGRTRFYCGRKVMSSVTPAGYQTDGWCGENDGDNCNSCKTIQYQLEEGCYFEMYR